MENEIKAAEQPVVKSSKKAEAEYKGSEPTVHMGVNEIIALVTSAVQASEKRSSDATADALKALAEAIKDSRKPYIDPRSEFNDKMMRDQMREVNERMAKNIKASQAACQHLQGSNENSDFTGQLTSIVKHYTDAGVQWGICTNCLRQFWPGQHDYVVQMNRKSGNRTSMAGRRYFADPQAAAIASMPKPEERELQPTQPVYA